MKMIDFEGNECLIDLNLKPLKNKKEKWFNLYTGRICNEQKFDCIYNSDTNICGPPEAIEYLHELNNFEKIQSNITDKDKQMLDYIDPHEYDVFSLRDLVCVGKVVKVIDGDTVDVLVKIPIKDLKSSYCKRRKKSLDLVKNCEITNTNENENEDESRGMILIAKINCRFFGIDTPSHNCDEGFLSTSFVTENMLNKFFTCKFFGIGSHGRQLTLFFDSDNICINKKMIQQGLGVPYYGGHKH